jgi:hypothetical protein
MTVTAGLPEKSRVDELIAPIRKMLVGGEKFWMGWVRIGGGSGYVDLRVDIEGYRREADFVVAGLVMEL